MKMTRYACTHCGRKFEAEEKEILECPGCYWSTSVKKEEDLDGEKAPLSSSPASKTKSSLQIPWGPVLAVVAALLLTLLFMQAGLPLIQKTRWQKQHPKKTVLKAPEKETPVSSAKPEQSKKQEGGLLSFLKPQAKPKIQAAPDTDSSTGVSGLSAEENNILSRRLEISADREPSPEELDVLKQRAAFKTGFIEKLPSQTWTLENFKKLITDNERLYQVPLPGSYKRKLDDLFKTKYLLAVEAFNSGEVIKARDLWVESLAFPIYANNVQKHRGVILTMLRPYINDTLAKIGTVNSSLVEKVVREKEQAAAAAYENFLSLLETRKWQESLDASSVLLEKINSLANPERVSGSPGQYPAAIAQVDSDIQAALAQLLAVPPPAISDFDPIRQDLLAKRRVIQSFLAADLDQRRQTYQEALDLISRREWAQAETKLKQIDTPLELSRDAAEKIRVLKKLQQSMAATNSQSAS